MLAEPVRGSPAIVAGLTGLAGLPAIQDFVVDTPDLSALTQFTAQNDEVHSATWH